MRHTTLILLTLKRGRRRITCRDFPPMPSDIAPSLLRKIHRVQYGYSYYGTYPRAGFQLTPRRRRNTTVHLQPPSCLASTYPSWQRWHPHLGAGIIVWFTSSLLRCSSRAGAARPSVLLWRRWHERSTGPLTLRPLSHIHQ